jgi:hypothetical protein
MEEAERRKAERKEAEAKRWQETKTQIQNDLLGVKTQIEAKQQGFKTRLEAIRQERRKHRDANTWEERYPNLERYLGILRAIAPLIAAFTGVMIFATMMSISGDPKHLATWLFILMAAAISGGVGYMEYFVLVASIEFVCVACSAEQEAVNSRKLLADIASRLPDMPSEGKGGE